MINIGHILLTTLVALLLSACSEFQHHRETAFAPVVTRGYGTEYWLAELNRTRQMTSEELGRTVAAWQTELETSPGDGNRIRLALLLTAGDMQVRDTAAARQLLDELDEVPANTSDRELLAIMRQIIGDQASASESILGLKRQLSRQTRRIEELEQQQRALTDIEQNIQHRDSQPGIEHGAE